MAESPQYGTDLSALTGLDPMLRLVSGSALMVQVAFRRLYCRKNNLFSDPDQVTLDVRDFLGEGLTRRGLPRIAALCQSALMGDERIFSATVTATLGGPDGRTLYIDAAGTGSQGPFSLVLAVSDEFGVQLLRSQ